MGNQKTGKQAKERPEKIPAKKAEPAAASYDLGRFVPWAIMLVTAIVYSKAIHFELTNFDDDFYINKNPFLRDFSLSGVKAIFSSFYTSNYHPFTTLTFLLEYHFRGVDPLSYHVINVCLHVINTGLVFLLAKRLSGNQVTAIVVASLFGLHPMHVESVAWVSERKDVLYSAFYLLSLIAYLKFRDTAKWGYYALCLTLFLCSLFSKSAAVTLPVLLVAIDWYRGQNPSIKRLLPMAPFWALSLFFGILNIMAQTAGGAINDVLATYNLFNRFFLFTGGIGYYLFSLVLPVNLCAMHFFPNLNHGLLPWAFYASLPFDAVVLYFLFRKGGSARKDRVFGVAFFLIAVSVMLQIKAFGSAYASERYTYIPYIGLFYIVGQWMSVRLEKAGSGLMIWGGFGAVLLTFGALTINRMGYWENGVTLFTDVVDQYPDQFIGYWLRGNLLKQAGDADAAFRDYSKAIALNPKDEDSHFNRGKIFDERGDFAHAIKDYDVAIRLDPKKADAYNNRGWAYFEQGDTTTALRNFDTSLSLDPKFAEAYNNRGWVNYVVGNKEAAFSDFSNAIKYKPEFLKSYFNRALVSKQLGHFTAARDDYSRVLQINAQSPDAWFQRGVSELNLGDTASACADWHHARELGMADAGKAIAAFCK